MKDKPFGRGLLHQYGALLIWLTALLDIVLIVSVYFSTLYINRVAVGPHYTLALCVAVVLFVAITTGSSFYRVRRTSNILQEVLQLLLAWLLSVGSLFAFLFVFDAIVQVRSEVLTAWFVITPAVLIALRLFLRGASRLLRQLGGNFRHVAIIGATEMGERIHRSIVTKPWMGMRFSGFFDARSAERLPDLSGFAKADVEDLEQLFDNIAEAEIDIVYIALPMSAQARIKAIVERLNNTPVSVYYAPDFYSFDLFHARWDDLDGQPIISIVEMPFIGDRNILKRIEDMLVATLALALLALPLLLVAIIIKLDSPGPVFYRQRRYGMDGRAFSIWKFRSMSNRPDAQVFVQATQNDPRVTRVGRFIRKYSIDELPQIFNVLVGNMSIVGPRPHPTALDDEHQDLIRRYNLRFKAKPGITGLAQINGYRGETDTLDKMQGRIQYDLEYIRNWSLWLDIKIILLTFVSVVEPVNAH